MSRVKIAPLFVSSLLTSFLMTSCMNENKAMKIGVTAGPHALIMEMVKKEAKKKGLNIDVIEFNDFVLPNIVLAEGDLDANSYQHQPYLDNQNQQKGFKLVTIAKTILMPMGIYSHKIKKIADLKDGAKVGIPNDPSNGARALKLLETAGLIKLKSIEMPTILDITENPKNLDIVELEAPQVLRSLDDLDCAVTNTDWIMLANMDPQSALLHENKDSPYANIIVVKESRKDEADFKTLVETYHSQPVKDYITTEFKGAIIPVF